MSATFSAYVSSLFGREERSDCTVVFYCSSGSRSHCDSDSGSPRDGEHRESEPAAQPREYGRARERDPPAPTSASRQPSERSRQQQDPLEYALGGTTKAQEQQRQQQKWPWDDDNVEARPPAARHSAAAAVAGDRDASRKSRCPLPDGTSLILTQPLPAHTFVLCGGSQRFAAQIDRWAAGDISGGGARPEMLLRVPLDEPEDLPYALAAMQYMYTGRLPAELAGDAAGLLRLRRQAAYLQVEGCTEACEQALLALVAPPASAQQGPRQRQQRDAGAGASGLAGVWQLLCCRDLLLASVALEPSFVRGLMQACRHQLVKHAAGSAAGRGGLPPSGPGLGEALAWAFGDAPSLLSDPRVTRQFCELPAVAIEAMLGSEALATDSEDTVLLMLLRWLQANAPAASVEVRRRLLRLVRLSQLSNTYLHRVAPLLLPTLGVSPQELRFLQEYAFAPDSQRARLRRAAEFRYDMSSAWYAAAPRPAEPGWEEGGGGGGGCRSYEWHVDAAQLAKAGLGLELAAQQGCQKPLYCRCAFANGAACVVARGFEWYPLLKLGGGGGAGRDADKVRVSLRGALPAALRLEACFETPTVVSPGACRLAVYRGKGEGAGGDGGGGGCSGGGGGGGGSRCGEEAWSCSYGDADFVQIDTTRSGMSPDLALAVLMAYSRGQRSASASTSTAAAAAAPIAAAARTVTAATPAAASAAPADSGLPRWETYLRDDGKLWGCLSWVGLPEP
ncbi:hypothetical protein PLESTB_001249000 [Pleodorina starrii]|uniref:BACK domain-containing protein n=1 Tax=Pleodorina starrii TaxID=330485 RepID=A0A9W6BSH2_9CHLO|nr:hypothetical protein PLESTM_000211000 [Pleodorina starrii]GLC57641.1 hypothetical protein PLESTB_001249000 [Pleodorina starrii]